MNEIKSLLDAAVQNKRVTRINDIVVVTDIVDYREANQVLPILPEQQFLLDELVQEKIQGASVLEIGVGSGVLSIGAMKAGAKQVTALEINPRAKIFAGFNILLNGLEGHIKIVDGCQEDIWSPVAGEQFDYIISNPPFVPTPPKTDYYMHSSSGLYGLDFIESIFQKWDEHLSENGHGQIVTAAPGNETEPFMLVDLAKQYLSGTTTIKITSDPVKYDEALKIVLIEFGTGTVTPEQIEQMRRQAEIDGVSHWHSCVIHYDKGAKNVTVQSVVSPYSDWGLPIKDIAGND